VVKCKALYSKSLAWQTDILPLRPLSSCRFILIFLTVVHCPRWLQIVHKSPILFLLIYKWPSRSPSPLIWYAWNQNVSTVSLSTWRTWRLVVSENNFKLHH
jgi:hypothetical protein